jgi:hypothetical protein
VKANRRYVLAAVIIGLLSACAHKPPRVDCEGHMEPINRPAAMEGRERSGSSESAPSPKNVSEQQGAPQSSPVDHSTTQPPGNLPERAP